MCRIRNSACRLDMYIHNAKDKGISLKAVTPPQLLFRIKRNYERKKEEAKVSRKLSLYFFFSECIMHCLHGETKGKNFDDEFSYFTLSRFQTGSTYAIHNATIRVSGNLMEKPPGRNHKFFKFRPFVSGGFPLVASSQTRSR